MDILKRAALFLLLCLALLPAPALADMPSEEQLQPLEELVSESGARIDLPQMIRVLMSGEALDPSELLQSAKDALQSALNSALALLGRLMVPVLLMAILGELIPEGDKKTAAAGIVCYLAAALMLMQAFSEHARTALTLIQRMGRLIEALFPILSALMVACGWVTSAAAFAPLLSLGAGLLSGAVGNVSLALCRAAAVVAAFGSLSERFSLGKLLSLMKSALNWIIGLALTGFLGFTSLQNLLSAGQDSANMRAAKYAVGNLIPGVGGEVADTMNAALSSAILVKNATGATGLVLMLALSVEPLIRLLLITLILRLGEALSEPLNGGQLGKLISRFTDVFQMLLMAAAAAVVIGVILVGATLSVGGAALP